MHRCPTSSIRRLLLALPLLSFLVAPAIAGTADDVPIPTFDHIIMVIMENHSYAQSISPPYTSSLRHYGTTFNNSHALTHPSQPNYFDLWCGAPRVNNDNCPPTGAPYATVQNLGHLCEVFGLRWRAYSEGLPAVGSTVCTSGLYVRRHCPWVSFGNATHANERPFTDLANDIANDSLPRLSVVVPDLCNDGHNNCDGNPIAYGDTWLSTHVPQMLSAMGPNGLFILTWDEDDNSASNQILTLMVSPLIAQDTISTQHITHFTVLKTICEGLGLPPFAGAVAETSVTGIWKAPTSASPLPVPRVFQLSAPRPNPARGTVAARLTLPAPAPMRADVVDVGGHRVRTLVDGQGSGEMELTWDGRDESGELAPGGIYFMRVEAFGRTASRKLLRIN